MQNSKAKPIILPLKEDLVFTVGSFIKLSTVHGEIITGEVLAFQYELKLIVLKIQSPTNPKLHTVTVVNLSWCDDVKILNESDGINAEDVSTLPEMNLQKIDQRLKRATASRRATMEAYSAGVTAEGVQLYISLVKTFGASVRLNKSSIIVKNVKVIPPYRQDCVVPMDANGPMVNPPTGDTSMSYVRQLVDKFWQDQNIDSWTLEPLLGSSKVSSSTESPSTPDWVTSTAYRLESLDLNGHKNGKDGASSSGSSGKPVAGPSGVKHTPGSSTNVSSGASTSSESPKSGKGANAGGSGGGGKSKSQASNIPPNRN